MTVKECYDAMGADYDDVLGRLRTDERIQKFLLKVIEDQTYELLCTSLKNGDMDGAFRAAHTLKGISLNLSLTALYNSSSRLSDYLKEKKGGAAEIERMMTAVKADYKRTLECIEKLKASI
jgi:HPt (histidine-containing phosphotransfer) domain-containing protein